ncbi:hypothetical protein P2Q62_20300, partial [Escherichia coli]
ADRNRSHWSTSKTPSYTKSVSWQHHPCVVSLDSKGIYSQVKCLIKYTNLVIINIYSGRMTREVDGQQTQSVIYSLLNKTPDASPDSASNTSVICTILSLLNLVKPVQTRRETHT